MDGSDQLSNGVPQFRETSKDDCGQARIKNHLEIVQAAASPDIVKCFVVPEDIANDTDVSIEVLQRTLKAEERRRGRLPPILNLQLDNCAGSNKNTYLFSYLAWLVERGVFTVVYVSFLPVGHTHYGPDRICSRISNAVRRTNIFSQERFLQLIEGKRKCSFHSNCLPLPSHASFNSLGSHLPRPYVEVIDRVAGFKKLVNPGASASFVGGRCRQFNGMCTLRPATLSKYARFMETTSNLHFRIAKDPKKEVVCVQNKQTIDVADWSPVEYVWCDKGERYSHGSEDFTSWLRELMTAPSVPISTDRREELEKYLAACSWRLDADQLFAFQQQVRHLNVTRAAKPLHWDDEGQLVNERDQNDDELEDDGEDNAPSSIQIRDGNCIIRNQDARQALHNQALVNTIRPDIFIAYKPFYQPHIPMDQRQPIYVGQVMNIHADQKQVQIQCYNTGTRNPLKKVPGKSTKYKTWRAGRCSGCRSTQYLSRFRA